MPDAFTLQVFVPSGDPEGLRFFEIMNWTGKGLIFPRDEWENIKERNEFSQIGIYILYGYGNNQSIDNEDLPTIYIGQGDVIRNRISSHYQNKDFWDSCFVFISKDNSLNRAHITWLEYALIQRATKTKRSILSNKVEPNEPHLSESDKAGIESILRKIYQIFPFAGIRVFETPKPVSQVKDIEINPYTIPPSPEEIYAQEHRRVFIQKVTALNERDTVIVPAQRKTFEDIFLAQNRWYQIRIGGGMLNKIKYLAVYQTDPIRAITHVAPVDRIEPYGDQGKYVLYFSERPRELSPPVVLGSKSKLAIQGPIYTSIGKLMSAKDLSDIRQNSN